MQHSAKRLILRATMIFVIVAMAVGLVGGSTRRGRRVVVCQLGGLVGADHSICGPEERGGFHGAGFVVPQPTATPESIDRPTSEPYKGDLSIFDRADRDTKLQIDRVMDVLEIREGVNVADLGAGSGWFTIRAARRSITGTIFAIDINPESTKYIDRRAAEEKLINIKTILGKEDDPLLPKSSVDVVLILKTYHEISQPIRLLRNLRPALSDGARVAVIDKNGRGDDHGIDSSIVIREFDKAGFSLAAQHDFVKGDSVDYLLVFKVK